MRIRSPREPSLAEPSPEVAVIRRKRGAIPKGPSIEQKLQADVAAWLEQRRTARKDVRSIRP